MVFSSALFLLYFLPVFLLAYYLVPRKIKNVTLLVFSLGFFAWGAPDFIFIVLASIIFDYYLVGQIPSASGRKRKTLAVLSVILNVGLLGYFKYANFFVENLNTLLESAGMETADWTAVALPIGISFFTFQKITYMVDTYRGVHKPFSRITDYAVYILMFPHLIAGPIVRFNEIADQIADPNRNMTVENRFTGFFRFVIGLSKKVLIANVLGETADVSFAADARSLGSTDAWLGVVAYAFQIYFDFSGYSDMAIGLARMLGFRFPENFNNPYISRNITEFWRRWHITLGRFMRDYLYIPMGGNRTGKARMYLNLWLVFFISGLWHGAAWNFIAWGLFHGLFLVADRLFLERVSQRIGKVPSIALTFLITLVGWVFFRSETIGQAFDYLHAMFAFRFSEVSADPGLKFYVILVVAALASFSGIIRTMEPWQERILSPATGTWQVGWRVGFATVFFVMSLSAILATGFNPFIYFRF
jgi:alginate O-acetyltransferase complex protein AlgI